MILTCPECEISYELPNALPEGGCKVRCMKCSHVWHATENDLQPLPSESAEQDPPGSDDQVADVSDKGEDDMRQAMEVDLTDQEIPAVSPFDDDLEEIVFDIDEEETGEEESNSQDDIDSLFDSEPDGQDDDEDGNSQDDIDSLFDSDAGETDDEGEDSQDQAGIDALFGVTETDVEAELDTDAEAQSLDKENKTSEDEPEGQESKARLKDLESTLFLSQSKKLKIDWKTISKKELAGWAGYAASLLLFCSVIYLFPNWVVRYFPVTYAYYQTLGYDINIRGITFNNIKQHWEHDNGVSQLRVTGELTNIRAEMMKVPPVVFSIKDKEKTEIYRWVMPVRKQPLMPGERAAFLVRIPPPPKQGHFMQLHFAKP